tara:strand:- start:13075 stop:14382 length:1308 start_codon:yes stop_codon:yes gene_type:complete
VSNVKIVVVGIGSASFGPRTLGDILARPELSGSELHLVDIRSEALDPMTAVAHRMNEEWSAGFRVHATTDLVEALPGADFVICMIEANRDRLWQLDMQIPHKYGVMQVLGENGGPGGLSHTLRTVPLVLDVARHVEAHAPDAWFLNYTNPLPRICRGVTKYTSVKTIGFCHGIGSTVRVIGELLDLDPDEFDVRAAGLNHFHWVMDVRSKDSGEDLYPSLRERAAAHDPGKQHLWSDLFRTFGWMPFPSDDHVGEYLPFMHVRAYESWQKYDHDHWLLHWDGTDSRRDTMWEEISERIDGSRSIDDLRGGSGERAIPVLVALRDGLGTSELALNIPNDGYISNLPDDVIVEVPATVGAGGPEGHRFGDLPSQIAAWCSNQVHVAELAVDAAVTGDRAIALQSLLADPVINDIDTAEKILDEYLSVHSEWLPQFVS